MKEKLINNLGLKILSIVLAFVVWILVVNVSNPEVTRTKEVTINIQNESVLTDAQKTYEISGKSTVTVSYQVRTRDEYRIKASDFAAYIDLADMYEITGSVPVTVEVVNNKDYIIGTPVARPGNIRVETEDIQNKKFELQSVVTGEPEIGYSVGEITLNPDSIYIKGPVSIIGQINRVGIEINISEINEDTSGTASPVCYDANGSKLNLGDDISFSNENINYTVVVLNTKNIGIEYSVSGTVADGYRYIGAESDINAVSVIGIKSASSGVANIVIPSSELNLDGLRENKTVQVDLNKYLPSGLSITGNSVVNITLKVEALQTKTISVDLATINIVGAKEGYSYSYGSRHVDIMVSGLAADLDTLTAGDLGISVDLTDLNEGSHPGKLEFAARDGLEVDGYSEFNILVSLNETQASLESSEGAENNSESSNDINSETGSETVSGTAAETVTETTVAEQNNESTAADESTQENTESTESKV